MANTYTQIYIHAVFAVEGRQSLIAPEHKIEIYKYMTSVIQNQKNKVMAINGMPDHVHLLIGLNPDIALSDLVRDIKNNSSNFINDHAWVKGKFCWQEGYGAFSYSQSQVGNVYNYILNQEEHHGKQTFKTEYIDTLKKYEIEHEEKYLFEWINRTSENL